MLWSNFDKDGYCLALAHSENGRPDGKWVQDDEPILTKSNLGGYDGGHGMLFRALDGKLYTCLHSPNAKTKDGECEEVVIIPIDDTGDTLVPRLD
jgi:hypothetical protein